MTFTGRLEAVLTGLIAYSKRVGQKPETVVQYATKNPRLLPRMRRRAALLDADIASIERYIEKNPLPETGDSVANNNHTQSLT